MPASVHPNIKVSLFLIRIVFAVLHIVCCVLTLVYSCLMVRVAFGCFVVESDSPLDFVLPVWLASKKY